jgi:hypothetical protein
MSIATKYADHILQRARPLMLMESADRQTVKAALLDVTLAVANDVVQHYMTLAEQQHSVSSAHVGRIMRDMRTAWRAIAKRVKSVYATHPINDRILWATVAAHFPSRLREWPTVLTHDFVSQDQYYLLASTRTDARRRIINVLERYT